MTPDTLAALHAAAFTEAPRPWTATEFAAFLAQPGILLSSEPGGFALGRVAGPEAELLTLAVGPAWRRRGIGRRLLAAFEAGATAAGAEEALLEVSALNAAALALYGAAGFAEVGRRRGYYTSAGKPPVDALILRKSLRGGEFI